MKRHPQQRRAVATVEFAVVLPLLLVFLLGAWEVGRLIEVKQLLSNAAREGARQAAIGNRDTDEVKAYVVAYLHQNGLTMVTADNVTVTNVSNGMANSPKDAAQLDEFEITVSIPFDSVRWLFLNQLTDVEDISASAHWNSMKDAPVEVNLDIPLE